MEHAIAKDLKVSSPRRICYDGRGGGEVRERGEVEERGEVRRGARWGEVRREVGRGESDCYMDGHLHAPLCASMLVNSIVPLCFIRGYSL